LNVGSSKGAIMTEKNLAIIPAVGVWKDNDSIIFDRKGL